MARGGLITRQSVPFQVYKLNFNGMARNINSLAVSGGPSCQPERSCESCERCLHFGTSANCKLETAAYLCILISTLTHASTAKCLQLTRSDWAKAHFANGFPIIPCGHCQADEDNNVGFQIYFLSLFIIVMALGII